MIRLSLDLAKQLRRGKARLVVRLRYPRLATPGGILAYSVNLPNPGSRVGANVGYLYIESRDRMLLKQVAQNQHKAAGFPDPASFQEKWLEDHDRAWLAQGRDEGDRFARFFVHWAPRSVWVIGCRVAADPPLLLTSRVPTDAWKPDVQIVENDDLDPGYVRTGGMPLEPEAVDPSTLDAGWSEKAAQRIREARTDEQRRRELRRLGMEFKKLPVERFRVETVEQIARLLDSLKEDRAA